jgi:hypothetical protein
VKDGEALAARANERYPELLGELTKLFALLAVDEGQVIDGE